MIGIGIWLLIGFLVAMILAKIISLKGPKFYEQYKPEGEEVQNEIS